MVRWFVTGVALSLLGVVFFNNNSSTMSAAEGDDAEAIMKKLHKGKKPIHKMIGKDLEEKDVKWTEVVDLSKEYVKLAVDLIKTKPEKGGEASWKKLTKEYADSAKLLEAAAEKKDGKAATEAFSSLDTSCKECHKAHKN